MSLLMSKVVDVLTKPFSRMKFAYFRENNLELLKTPLREREH